MNLYTEALCFAAEAHDGQFRKYTGEPYIVHPIAVAATVREYGGTEEMIAAALLHDTLEDTAATYFDLEKKFGTEVANAVDWLTDCPRDWGSRRARKHADRVRLAQAPADIQTIKVADLIDNTRSIVAHDPKFAETYLVEKIQLLTVLTRAHRELHAEAWAQTFEAVHHLAEDIAASA